MQWVFLSTGIIKIKPGESHVLFAQCKEHMLNYLLNKNKKKKSIEPLKITFTVGIILKPPSFLHIRICGINLGFCRILGIIYCQMTVCPCSHLSSIFKKAHIMFKIVEGSVKAIPSNKFLKPVKEKRHVKVKRFETVIQQTF